MELKPVDLLLRLTFTATKEGDIETGADFLQEIVRCVDCIYHDSCAIRRFFAFAIDDTEFFCKDGKSKDMADQEEEQ